MPKRRAPEAEAEPVELPVVEAVEAPLPVAEPAEPEAPAPAAGPVTVVMRRRTIAGGRLVGAGVTVTLTACEAARVLDAGDAERA